MRLITRLAIAATLSCALAQQAHAQQLPIDGPYGNASGCELVRTGSTDTDAAVVLKPNELSEHESDCEFLDVKTARSGAHVVRTLCDGEGMMWLQNLVIVTDFEDEKALVVHFGDERDPVTVRPCG